MASTSDYIEMLYALEAGLYNENIRHSDIRRDADRNLHVVVKFKSGAKLDFISAILLQVRELGIAAVSIQKFRSTKIEFYNEVDHAILNDIIVV
jgi:hypothetical protein